MSASTQTISTEADRVSRPRRLLAVFVVAGLATLAAMGFASAPASAASVFTNATPITISTGGKTSPYPSAIEVQGQPGRVVDVAVTLHRFSHSWPDLVDILLVAPDGKTSLVMSEACGDTDVINATWVFSGLAPTPMPSNAPCDQLVYRPTDYAGNFADNFGPSAPLGPYTANFGNFIGASPNGTWRLYVIAPAISDSGKIDLGWSLTIDTAAAPDAVVPASSTGTGVADPYPITRTVSGVDGVITDIDVALIGVYHGRPADLEMMLEGPGGQKVALMSDVCGGSVAINQAWAWDDEALSSMYSAGTCPDGRYKPGYSDDLLPAPASMPLPLSAPLRDFDLTDPNGEWRLWVYDDAAGSAGLFTQRFRLDLQTRPKATVGFAQGAVDLIEGETRELTLVRSAETALGPATVGVTSSPVTAISDSDYKPLSREILFLAGETQKTISVEALTDALPEGEESFAVTIGQATGDAKPATPPTAVVTIQDPAQGPGDAADGDAGSGAGGSDAGAGAGGTGDDHVAPVVRGVRLRPATFVVARRGTARAAARGTVIGYTLSEPATVTLRIERASGVAAGRLRRAGRLGLNRVAFTGRIGRRALRPGAYRLRVRAVDQAGNRSAWRTQRFRIVG